MGPLSSIRLLAVWVGAMAARDDRHRRESLARISRGATMPAHVCRLADPHIPLFRPPRLHALRRAVRRYRGHDPDRRLSEDRPCRGRENGRSGDQDRGRQLLRRVHLRARGGELRSGDLARGRTVLARTIGPPDEGRRRDPRRRANAPRRAVRRSGGHRRRAAGPGLGRG